MNTNILNIVLAIIWTTFSIFISVNSTLKMIEDFIKGLKLKFISNYSVISKASSSILLKAFTNYL